ncbi:hypothetical protein ACN28C_03450 [Plantactinospora sp. WMMC1484]|uniref:hypothetical protein n=1 Tax=Plantactinospora sp. WMMC1484 TaxID=3404122 RepID=UPI003BF60A48
MSTSADGDGRPENGPFEGLPDLPAEWGRIVIPDDPAELAAEAAEVRRELRLHARHDVWRRLLGLPSATAGRSPLRLCLLIMSVALLATLTSLFAITWPGQQRPQATGRTSPSNPGTTPGGALPALDLVGEDGQLVPLRGLLPAVIMLVDGCACTGELDAAVRSAPPGVAVLAVSSRRAVPSARPVAPPARTPRHLTDPTSELRTALHLNDAGGAVSVVLASRSGRIVRTVPDLTSAADYQPDLSGLLTAA